jgi:hypothetical protein
MMYTRDRSVTSKFVVAVMLYTTAAVTVCSKRLLLMAVEAIRRLLRTIERSSREGGRQGCAVRG